MAGKGPPPLPEVSVFSGLPAADASSANVNRCRCFLIGCPNRRFQVTARANRRAAKRKKGQRRPLVSPFAHPLARGGRGSGGQAKAPPESLLAVAEVAFGKGFWVGVAIVFAALVYAYWPTWVWVEDAWRTEPDYSHGYLVPPLAAFLCWSRRDVFPGIRGKLSLWGVSLIAVGIVMRVASRLVYADFLDAWSILPMLAGAVWLLFGSAAMRWALPAIAFLFLMFPLPYQAESMLSWKLQGIATTLSTILLRIIGQPAIAEGHVIWIGDEQLFVEEACSGLRIFVGVAALAFFWAALTRRAWIDRVVLLSATLPLAIFVNGLRITSVGLIYQWTESPVSRSRVHEWTGILMIPAAFALLYLVKTYWQALYRPMERLTAKQLVPNSLARSTAP